MLAAANVPMISSCIFRMAESVRYTRRYLTVAKRIRLTEAILHLPSTLPTLLAIQLNVVQYEYRRAPLRRKLCEYCKINESTLQCTCDCVICSYSHQISEQIIVVTINRSQKRNAMHVTARDALSKREDCSTESNLSTRQPLPWPNPQLKACAIVNYTPSHPPPSLPHSPHPPIKGHSILYAAAWPAAASPATSRPPQTTISTSNTASSNAEHTLSRLDTRPHHFELLKGCVFYEMPREKNRVKEWGRTVLALISMTLHAGQEL